MRFTSIASGSSGNVSYIGTEETHILVDAGVTMKAINEGLASLSLSLRDISAIFITHEHIDHIRALGTISRKYGIPVYGTLETLREVLLTRSLGAVDRELLHPILPDQKLQVGDLEVLPFSISHDAANPCAYRIGDGRHRVAVATDLGHFDAYICEHLSQLDAMLVEANHDLRMLETGPYPVALKRRILSDHGHLSNDNAGKMLNEVLHDGIRHIFLGHLSKENNLPALALRTVQSEIDAAENGYRGKDFDITVASRSHVSEIVEL